MNEVEEIKQRLDVAEVVGSYIQLKQAGRNLKAACPFHQEKTASFMVSPEKAIWHCFGCNQGGDVFKFVMMIEGLEFKEALEVLARRAGVELKNRSGSGSGKQKQRLSQAVAWAVKYYQACLAKNPKALNYVIRRRGLTRQAVEDFQIGYAPDVWEGLTRALTKKGFSNEELIKAGLVGQKAGRSSIYDLLRGRLIFTICDSSGNPVGFTGRILDGADDVGPKYLNTPQSLLYDKSRVIYGLHLAREAIRENDEVVLVEGNMDVVTSHQAGVRQVVAVSGTALTIDQLKALRRLTHNVKLAFDQDSAGLVATERAIELSQNLGLNLMVVETGDAKDADELIKQDVKLWQTAIANAKYVMDYLFDYFAAELDLATELGKKQFSDRLAPVIQRLADPAEKSRYIEKLADLIGTSQDATAQKVDNYKSHEPANARAIKAQPVPVKRRDGRQRLEESILAISLAYPDARSHLSDLKPGDFTNPECRLVFEALMKPANRKQPALKLAQLLPDQEDYVKILTLQGEQDYSDLVPADRSFESFMLTRRLQNQSNKLLKTELSQKLRQAEQAGDVVLARSLLSEFQSLIREDD